jgi:putative two-component system response regulator
MTKKEAEALRVVEDDKLSKCHCHDFWNRGHQCENCISRKVLRHKGQKSKLQYIDNDIFQVIAKYLEVDGKPCVMEMIEKIDADEFVDSENGERLVGKITGYTEKMYEGNQSNTENVNQGIIKKFINLFK